MARQQSDDLTASAGNDPAVQVQLEAVINGEIRIQTAPAMVFAFLTDARRMMSWLAWDANADPRPGGVFRLADFSGLWVEGVYLEVIAHRRVVFSWGGIDGLKGGQSIVEFALQREDNSTMARLRHCGLSGSAATTHRLYWKHWGLPKLKAVAEGTEAGLTCLGEVADWRERHPYFGVACEDLYQTSEVMTLDGLLIAA